MKARVRGRFDPWSDFEIETYLCGDGDPDLRARIEASARDSKELRAYLAERRAQREAFLTLHPVLPPSPKLEARRSWLGSARTWWLSAAVGLSAAAAGVALWVQPSPNPAPRVSSPDLAADAGIRTRGGLTARLVIRRKGRTFDYDGRFALRPGDQARIVVESPHGGYVTVIGEDEADAPDGKLPVFYDNAPLGPGRQVLPGSLTLDDRVGTERWVVFHAREPVSTEELRAAVRQGRPVEAAQTVLTFIKGAAKESGP